MIKKNIDLVLYGKSNGTDVIIKIEDFRYSENIHFMDIVIGSEVVYNHENLFNNIIV